VFAALVVHEVSLDVEKNIRDMERAIVRSARLGAQLVLFSEAAATGLVNNDDPDHDRPFFEPIPGPLTRQLACVARAETVFVGLGLLESHGDHLYDSAVLLSPTGDIVLHYRRMNPQWHGPHANPEIYREGTNMRVADTMFARMAFLICGDLFDDSAVASLRQVQADYVLMPMVRCFADGSHDQERWDHHELPAYSERAAMIDAVVLAVNCLAPQYLLGGSFGGATVFAPSGDIVDALPLGEPGILLVEV